MAIIFDGRKMAGEIEEKLKGEVVSLKNKTGVTPKLVSFLVGDDPASVLYTKIKQKKAESVGIEFLVEKFDSNIDPTLLRYRIRVRNEDKNIHGIMVQLPLPEKYSVLSIQSSVLNSIDPKKDVDCLTTENLELLKTSKPRFIPATVLGITKILYEANSAGVTTVTPQGCKAKTFCIVGASGMVGRPLSDYLKSTGATVFECDENTPDISVYTKQADILISATGIPNLIKKEMVKPDAVVIDVGSPVGDVDFENVSKVASFITPVPGGVGPLTVISLLENTLESCYRANT